MENHEDIRARRSAVALSACPRWQLAEGLPQGATPPTAFFRTLKQLDRDLELYWHPVLQRWILYRVVRRAAAPSEDFVVKECEVVGPDGEYREPGPWLLDILRQSDKTRGGTISPGAANRAYMRALDEQFEADNARKEKLAGDITDNVIQDSIKYAMGRHSVHVNRM